MLISSAQRTRIFRYSIPWILAIFFCVGAQLVQLSLDRLQRASPQSPRLIPPIRACLVAPTYPLRATWRRDAVHERCPRCPVDRCKNSPPPPSWLYEYACSCAGTAVQRTKRKKIGFCIKNWFQETRVWLPQKLPPISSVTTKIKKRKWISKISSGQIPVQGKNRSSKYTS